MLSNFFVAGATALSAVKAGPVVAGAKMMMAGSYVMQLTGTDFNTMAQNFAGVVATVLSAVGVILCLWGGFNFAMSLEARDNNQRIQGAITFFSGILLLVLPQVVNTVSGGSVTVAPVDITG